MKHYKTRVIPERIDEILFRTTCDLCSKEIEQDEWDRDEVTVENVTGYSCPSGGASSYEFVDMCGSCFRDKLIPWLTQQGATIQTKETDW